MKWYSVKKYRPPYSGYCLIRTSHGDFHCAEWKIGHKDIDDNSQYSEGWLVRTFAEPYDGPEFQEVLEVTHFAIIEPVEI